ncbi:MAG TPA: cupin domain-containing protein [Chromatiaceae bacterium]|nr:cupin domain-containing protein [Chromatiaceae bacterium]
MITSTRLFEHFDAHDFLREHWQRKPLLMRNAMPPPALLDPEELAGLACENEVESRLIIGNRENDWQLHHGPFSEADFDGLPDSDWTLLVQDMDKWLPGFAALLDHFRFLPDWRIDDAMVSYAVEGGSVGPHTDSYDVFLLQMQGRREWRVMHQAQPDPTLSDNMELRIMRDFHADETWLLEPGDILYLPADIPHWGIARGACMTCSVGFRAPSQRELLGAATTWMEEHLHGVQRYLDPPLADNPHPAELEPRAFARFKMLLDAATRLSETELHAMFAHLMTEPKPGYEIEPNAPTLDNAAFHAALREHGVLYRHPAARFTYYRDAGGDYNLWVGGESFPAGAEQHGFLGVLAAHASLHAGYLEPWLEEPRNRELLTTLYNRGIYDFQA